MSDLSEQILDAVFQLVTGLATTGANVQRSMVYPAGSLPALSVDMGAEQPDAEANMQFQDEAFEVDITAYVQATDGVLDTELNAICAEVYKAMLADYTLGLPFVRQAKWNGRDRPQRSDGEQTPITQQTFHFIVHYRHSYLDMGA